MERDPGFRQALLEEGIERLLAGEVDLGKAVLRDYVNATIGFDGGGGFHPTRTTAGSMAPNPLSATWSQSSTGSRDRRRHPSVSRG